MTVFILCCLLFYKQKTAYSMRISDWSSDVCSSDLACKCATTSECRARDSGDQRQQIVRLPRVEFLGGRYDERRGHESFPHARFLAVCDFGHFGAPCSRTFDAVKICLP